MQRGQIIESERIELGPNEDGRFTPIATPKTLHPPYLGLFADCVENKLVLLRKTEKQMNNNKTGWVLVDSSRQIYRDRLLLLSGDYERDADDLYHDIISDLVEYPREYDAVISNDRVLEIHSQDGITIKAKIDLV